MNLEPRKRLRIVLDTNVLFSALRFHGNPERLWGLAEERKFDVFVSPFILEELERALRDKAQLSTNAIKVLIHRIRRTSQTVSPEDSIHLIREKESDNRILECAIEAKADVLVTGNMAHIRPLGSIQDIGILTPREFLEKYFPAG